jgi:hypothetical protein
MKNIKNCGQAIILSPRQLELFGHMTIMANGPEIRVNPFSGVEVLLDPVAVAFYDVINGSEKLLNARYPLSIFVKDEGIVDTETLLEMFYEARDVFINSWPEHYSTLID